ncbi:GlcG/HbpS family heme-binding protein [Terasakiella pusilla]|uniref:GlcG/HbpS family heme-binding protein n=1 Tax=Terasakiella pusilla TaxID=64973 RepID=UPI00048F72E4|nr:heme-binding protein [Terasakiella pusilla]
MIHTCQITSLSLECANKLADAAINCAREMGLAIHVHIVDHYGQTLSYQRMIGAPLPAGDIALKKAATSAHYKTATDIWSAKVSKKPNVAAGLAHHPQIVLIGGGVPVHLDDQVVGAIGIAGASEEQDIMIANRAVETVLNQG